MVIAGCVDGCSRAIIYLSCADNNRAITNYRCFLKAVNEYQVPSRVRGN